ncbi:hypothetical protein [Paenibacillus ginsengarvi]|uniref:Uncharacterized protein n=1 Tax=Paenibacillus ginsengarvi TaxID=400777 RepID=A0A3B0AW88_9BACL|nr:hypothetical protein [Paenibacillus ginsengarvi]RKN64583.1 hypothetical protein D7M11_33605 [Paenibacillus ginsengarvi]
MNNNEGYSASGTGGQTINVLPHQNMVVVTTGSTTNFNLPTLLLEQFIIPSISSKPLENISIAGRTLQEVLHAESPPVVSQTIEIPPFAKDISGKRYDFENGAFSYTFDFLNNNVGSLTIEFKGVKRTRSFGFNGNYMAYYDPSEISPINSTVATATFDNNAINLQLKELQSYAEYLLTFTLDHDKVKLKLTNLYNDLYPSSATEAEGKLAQ